MSDLMQYWPIVGTVVIPALIWAIRMGLASKKDLADEAKARTVDLGELEKRLNVQLKGVTDSQAELSDRTLRMETEIRHLPSADDIADLKASLGRTDTRFEGLMREMQSITRALTRIEDHLFKGHGS